VHVQLEVVNEGYAHHAHAGHEEDRREQQQHQPKEAAPTDAEGSKGGLGECVP